MREHSFSFILKISVLCTSQDAEGEIVLRGSLRQVGVEQPRHFVSFERLVELLQETIAPTLAPIPPAPAHPEQVAPET